MPLEFNLDKNARKVFDDYANGKPARMAFVNSYDNGKQALLEKVATPLASIFKNNFGHSILVAFDTQTADELNRYDAMANRLIPNGFTYKKLLFDDDKMYLKLKIKGDKYEAIDWASPDDEDINLEGTNLKMRFNFNIWLNFEAKTAGGFFKIISLTKV